ncbi:MAG: poly-gamma-glutamate biosynthesis protein PgsC [Deltaproteobacteria bacterium]|nr:poly-gamma-glutamate biosynthesis protein PgsC [Deltaproteobacteria bacterium]
MEDLIPNAIGIGLVVSLVFSETMGLAAGGMVVPGYFALNLNNPLVIVVTLVLGIVAWLVVRLLGSFTILFGRRRTVVIILIGFLLGMFFKSFMFFDVAGQTVHLAAIGFIIPGLVGLWIDRQGVAETSATLITSAVIVKLVLVCIYGGELYEWL